MTKAELIAALAPFDDQTDIWIHAPGRVSEKATAVRYVPPMGSDYAFLRIVSEPSDNCEHGIPRRFCTALHAETVGGDA